MATKRGEISYARGLVECLNRRLETTLSSEKSLPSKKVMDLMVGFKNATAALLSAYEATADECDDLQQRLNETQIELSGIQNWKEQLLQVMQMDPSTGSNLDSEQKAETSLTVKESTPEVLRVQSEETYTREQVFDSSSVAEEACTSCDKERQLEEKLAGLEEELTSLRQRQLADSQIKSEEKTPEKSRMARKFSRLKKKAFGRKQGKEEPVLVYIKHKHAHVLRLDPPLPEEEQVDLIVKGMLSGLQENLRLEDIRDVGILKTEATRAEQQKILKDLAGKPVKIDQPSRSRVAASATGERRRDQVRSIVLLRQFASMVGDRLAVLTKKTRPYSWRTGRGQSPQNQSSAVGKIKNQSDLTRTKSDQEVTREKVPLEEVLCYKCKKKGHYRYSCPNWSRK